MKDSRFDSDRQPLADARSSDLGRDREGAHSRVWLYCLIACLVFSVAALLATIFNGHWSLFGSWLRRVPATLKTPDFRGQYLLHWVGPAAATYAAILVGTIFLGLRKIQKGA